MISTAPALPTLLVIPTGVGCAVGGYAGDALPAARLLAAASGCLITHPNVMKDRIEKKNWVIDIDVSKKKFSFKNLVLYYFEKLTGIRLFDYKNYKITRH